MKRFVSSAQAGRVLPFEHPSASSAGDERSSRHDTAPEHTVQFYDDDAFLATVVGEFLARGLLARQPVVVIATPEHNKAFIARLRGAAIDVARARRTGQLTLLDARETLDQFMDGAVPNAVRFRSVVGSVIEQSLAGRSDGSVRAYGEMVDLLWKDSNRDGALQLEEMWNELASNHSFSLLCAYSMGNFQHGADSAQFERICAEHTHVVPTERYLQGDDAARLAEISVLEQRARALEAEIAHREDLERQLRESVAALQLREEDLRDVLENAAEGIHRVGADGMIQWANAAEAALLGYALEDYVAHHITEFHVDQPVIAELLERLARGEEVHGFNARLRHRDGSIRHVLINSNTRRVDGQFVHTRCFTRDITALHEASIERGAALERERVARAAAEDAIAQAEDARVLAERARADSQRALAVAEHANRAKSDFLAVMSHELRTPLNAIGGHAELMELGIHGPITEAQRDALDRIQRGQRLLLGLVNQVLNYARIETGSVRFVIEDVPLDELLGTVEGLLLPQIRARGLRFAYAGCPAELQVRADPEKVQQIVLNLLSNALKFTDPGGQLRLEVERERDHVRINVVDTGIGVPAEKMAMIFDPFVQVDANYTRTRDGVGLGLAISRDLARGMSGDLTAHSVCGVGSTFTLSLPRSPSA